MSLMPASRGFRPLLAGVAHRPRGRRAAAQPGLRAGAACRPASGRPVLLIPGFLAGDAVARHDDELAAAGGLPHAPHGHPRQRRLLRGGLRAARGAAGALGRAPRRARRSIIGQSRGGVFAQGARRARRPDLVERHRHARLADRLPARRPPARARPGRARRRARHRARAGHVPRELPARRVLRALPRRRSQGPFPEDVGFVALYSQAPTASSTGAPASTPRPTSSSRSAPRTAAWASTPRPSSPSPARCSASAATTRCSRTISRARPTDASAIAASIAAPGFSTILPWPGARRAGSSARRRGRSRARSGGARWRARAAGSAGWASRWWRRRRASSRRRRRQRAVAGVEEGDAGRACGRARRRPRASRRARPARSCASASCPRPVAPRILSPAGSPGSGDLSLGQQPRVARGDQDLRVRERGGERVEPADVVLVGVGERRCGRSGAAALRRGSPSRRRGERGVDQRQPVVLVDEVGVDEAAEARDADAAHVRSSSATHSMCGVCGNMSTGRTLLQRVAGLDELRRVGRERRRVAGDVDDPLRARPR